MSPVPLFSYSPPPGATLESRKNELIIYCLVVPWPGGYFWPPGGYPKKGLILASWGVGQKRANFGLPGVPPRPRGYTPRTGTFSHLGTPYPPGLPGQPPGTPQASPRVPPRPAPGYPPQASLPPRPAPRYPPPGCGMAILALPRARQTVRQCSAPCFHKLQSARGSEG